MITNEELKIGFKAILQTEDKAKQIKILNSIKNKEMIKVQNKDGTLNKEFWELLEFNVKFMTIMLAFNEVKKIMVDCDLLPKEEK